MFQNMDKPPQVVLSQATYDKQKVAIGWNPNCLNAECRQFLNISDYQAYYKGSITSGILIEMTW